MDSFQCIDFTPSRPQGWIPTTEGYKSKNVLQINFLSSDLLYFFYSILIFIFWSNLYVFHEIVYNMVDQKRP